MSDTTTIFETTPDSDTLGGRLFRSRESAGLTTKQVAHALGTSPRTVQNWENDRNAPTAHRLTMLAGLTGVGLSWLLHGMGNAPSEGDGPTETPAPSLDRIKALHLETGRMIERLEREMAGIASDQSSAGDKPVLLS
ncbi:MAG: transcriptional regulator [Mesorhizobium amorphae]|nr:MAG: transcriptional regulator [Mesorhizobium amorphae]